MYSVECAKIKINFMEYNHDYKRPLILHRLSSLSDEFTPNLNKNLIESQSVLTEF